MLCDITWKIQEVSLLFAHITPNESTSDSSIHSFTFHHHTISYHYAILRYLSRSCYVTVSLCCTCNLAYPPTYQHNEVRGMWGEGPSLQGTAAPLHYASPHSHHPDSCTVFPSSSFSSYFLTHVCILLKICSP